MEGVIENFNWELFDGQVDGVDSRDYPEFCDAFLGEGEYDGVEMTDEQCQWFTETYPEWINEQAYQSLIDQKIHFIFVIMETRKQQQLEKYE